MRWLVTLQVALGLAALFGLAHKSVDSVVAPVIVGYAEKAAASEARAAAAHLEGEWRALLEEQQAVMRDLVSTEAFSTVGDVFGDEKARGLDLALDAAIAEAGGEARAALLGPDAAPLVERDGAAALAGTEAAKVALSGTRAVRFERLEGQPHVVSASPLRKGEEVAGALVVARAVDERALRAMTQMLPPGTLVAITLDNLPLVHTAPEAGLQGRIGPQAMLTIGGEPYAVAQRPGGGGAVQVLGLAPVRGEGTVAAVQQVQLLVLVLGGMSIFLCAVVLLLSPMRMPRGEAPAAAEAGPAEVISAPEVLPAPEPALALDFPAAPPITPAPPKQPLALHGLGAPAPEPARPAPQPGGGAWAMPAPAAEDEQALQKAFSQKTLPNHPAPGAEPPRAPTPPPTSSSDLEAPLGGGRSPFAPQRSAPPSEPTPVSRGSAISTNPGASTPAPAPTPSPLPTPSFTPEAPEPAASPFDAIANAAVSRPPPMAPAPLAPPRLDEGDDLPAPKGGVPPELMAAERARQQRDAHARPPASSPRSSGQFGATPYDPELPAPKAPAAAPAEAPPSPATEPPRQPPGATQPPQPAIPLPGAAGPAPRAHDPWQNPSMSSMQGSPRREPAPPAPSSAPTGGSLPPAPSSSSLPSAAGRAGAVAPFDEAHYRSVYNEFVSSKAQLGESVDNITYEGFRAKLEKSEQALLDRHGCRAVRFQVLVKDRTVSLRPQLVR